jgi:hypothetical protein
LTWAGRCGCQHQSDTDQNDKCMYSHKSLLFFFLVFFERVPWLISSHRAAVLQSGRFLRRAATAQDILDGMVSFLAGILKDAVVRIAG